MSDHNCLEKIAASSDFIEEGPNERNYIQVFCVECNKIFLEFLVD